MTAIMGMVMMATPNEQFLQRAVTQTTITKKGMIMTEGIKTFTDNPSNDPLYITSYSFDKDNLLDNEVLNIIGEIKNNDTETADFVKLTATFYDANNRTLGSEVAFTDPTTLEPGQSGPFKMAAGILGNLNVDVDEIRYVKFHLNSN